MCQEIDPPGSACVNDFCVCRITRHANHTHPIAQGRNQPTHKPKTEVEEPPEDAQSHRRAQFSGWRTQPTQDQRGNQCQAEHRVGPPTNHLAPKQAHAHRISQIHLHHTSHQQSDPKFQFRETQRKWQLA